MDFATKLGEFKVAIFQYCLKNIIYFILTTRQLLYMHICTYILWWYYFKEKFLHRWLKKKSGFWDNSRCSVWINRNVLAFILNIHYPISMPCFSHFNQLIIRLVSFIHAFVVYFNLDFRSEIRKKKHTCNNCFWNDEIYQN